MSDTIQGPDPRTLDRALHTARRFLGQWSDEVTARLRDDLVQETVVVAWGCWPDMRRPERFEALVRTVARRLRARAVRRSARSLDRSCVGRSDEPCLYVAGQWVPRRVLRDALDEVLPVAGTLTARLLLGFYEGFTCSELALRYGLTESNVKVRLHRGRRRLQKEFERRLRTGARHNP